MKAEELDQKFDEGVSILEHFDLSTLKRPGLEIKRVNVDFPSWMVDALDQEAQRLGIHRQAVIKTWIAQLLDSKASC
jgi:hypothetical protein